MPAARAIRPGFGFRLGLEGRERVGPKLVEEVAQRPQALSFDGVDPLRAMGPVGHEAGVFQDAQMLGDRGPTHRKRAGQLADGPGPTTQAQQDGAASAVAEGVELAMMVSDH